MVYHQFECSINKVSNVQKLILVGGAAGAGVARTSVLIGKTFTRLGYYVFNYRDYPSLITGGHNFNVLKISDKPVYSHETFCDVIIALDQETIDRHEKQLNADGFVLGDRSLSTKNLVGVNVGSIIKKLGVRKVFGNNVLIGSLFKLFGLPIDPFLEVIEEQIRKKAEIVKESAREGYNAIEQRTRLFEANGGKKYFLTGNQAASLGAIASGLDVYIAYPITPATPVLHFLAARQLKHNFLVAQLENEIAVINAALGASYAGAMTMVGTSGAGFSLMAEAMSLQGMSEVPLVLYLGQRTGPATGVPTYTAQGDLKFALNAGHGEFPRVVIAPGDPKEAFYRVMEAFYLAYKYRVLCIVLSDKHLGESTFTLDGFEEPLVKPSRFIVEKPSTEYKSYLMTENGVSPRAVPGQGAFVRASSYEHDDYGYTTEDPEWVVKMNEKRLGKIEYLKQEIDKLNPVTVYGEGRNLIVGWGSTKGAILDAMRELDDFRFLQVSYLSPFPTDRVRKEVEASDNVVLVENNLTGLLGQVIAEKTGYFIKNKVLKYDARAFTSHELVNEVRKVIE